MKQAIWVPNIRIAQVATRLSFNHAPIHTIATSAFGLCAATGDYDVVAAAAGDEWSSSWKDFSVFLVMRALPFEVFFSLPLCCFMHTSWLARLAWLHSHAASPSCVAPQPGRYTPGEVTFVAELLYSILCVKLLWIIQANRYPKVNREEDDQPVCVPAMKLLLQRRRWWWKSYFAVYRK